MRKNGPVGAGGQTGIPLSGVGRCLQGVSVDDPLDVGQVFCDPHLNIVAVVFLSVRYYTGHGGGDGDVSALAYLVFAVNSDCHWVGVLVLALVRCPRAGLWPIPRVFQRGVMGMQI